MNFAENQKQATITVKTKDDTLVEKNETFDITLSAPSPGADISNPTATGKILNNDTVKLTLAKDKDTYHKGPPSVGTNEDKYTKVNAKGEVEINVSNLPENVAWEYNLNDGKGWQDGESQGSKTTSTVTIKDPSNTSWQGKKYNVSARIKEGQGYDEDSTKGTLGLTIDNKARVPTATSYENGKLVGYVEPDALVFDDKNNNGRRDPNEGYTLADKNGRFQLPIAGLKDYADRGSAGWDKIQARLVTIDKAGNTIGKNNQGFLYYLDALSGHDYFEGSSRQGTVFTRTHNLSNASDVVLVNGNIWAGTYNFNDGDDSLSIRKGFPAFAKVNMGKGQDYVEFNSSIVSNASLDMGAGDDVVRANNKSGATVWSGGKLDLGHGNDTLEVFHNIGSGNVTGNQGIDTFKIVSGQSSSVTQNLKHLEGFEIFDITGGKNNHLTISNLTDFKKNAGVFTDDTGKQHTAIMVKGDSGDKVDWYGSTSSVGTSTFNGVSYDIYTDNANNQLLVLSGKGITVI